MFVWKIKMTWKFSIQETNVLFKDRVAEVILIQHKSSYKGYSESTF